MKVLTRSHYEQVVQRALEQIGQFRAAFGSTPSAFRQLVQPRIELAATSGVHFDVQGHVPAFSPRDFGGPRAAATPARAASGRMSCSATPGRVSWVDGSPSGQQLSPGLSYELYRNHPGEVPKEQLHTELYLPIAE
jgi:hypothetical protein